MSGYTILIIGFLCIFVSIIFILRSDNKIKLIYEDLLRKHQEITEYVTTIERLIYDLDELVSKSLQNVDLINSNKSIVVNNDKNKKGINTIVNNEEYENCNNNYDKLLTLKKQGYKNIEIAKKLNIGVREVEIILKMNGYMDKIATKNRNS